MDPKLPNYSSPHPSPWQPYIYSLGLWVSFVNKYIHIISFYILYIRDAKKYFCFSVWLTSLSMTISRSTHFAANGILYFLTVSNIPLCIFTASSLSIPLSMYIYVASLSWLLLTVLLWTLGCMHLLGSCFSLDTCPGLELQNHMVVLFLVFEAISILFFIVAIPIYIFTNSVGGFPSLHSLTFIIWSFWW